VETDQHSRKIARWCTVSKARVVGPLFFVMTINAERYREIVELFIASLEPHERDCKFQQDETTAPTAYTIMKLLKEIF